MLPFSLLVLDNRPHQPLPPMYKILDIDETGQSSIIYLNQALQQQVSQGQTVPQLLGLSDNLSAFEYTITDNGRGDDTAVVEATLNETNPVTVSFTLTRQDGLWYISQIDQ